MWNFFKRKNTPELPITPQIVAQVEVEISQNRSAEKNKISFLCAEKILACFENSQGLLAPDSESELDSPRVRQQLYKILLERPLAPYSTLIRQVFEKEVQYRIALWDGKIKDDGDSYEGIYRCAFLLYRLGSTSDIHSLWVAKHINMDIGTSMGVEFFIGAGFQATVSYLAESNLQDADEISSYVAGWFDQDDSEKWQKHWELSMVQNISSTGDS
ncbi:hypothetical protein [Janthinobacterium sp. SUN033]|uniref:hypothetical protein n=1 Tax=Janthinobacterium sp. SUN033 TaxID=3002439 RepID=UPI0025B0D227|nr:hypothetical protein [Janthinobacterium sp. SUN033]MDN2676376.1 hypothetical protein [Janthinobacterium sp. SUN033]